MKTLFKLAGASLTLLVLLQGCTPTRSSDLSPGASGSPRASVDPLQGGKFPDFTLKDTQGKTYHMRDYNNKIVVVNFWATWCPPCKQELPDLQAAQTKYAKDGVQFLGLSVDENSAALTSFMKEHPFDYPVLLAVNPEGKKLIDALSSKYEMQAIPTTFVVDRNGKIAAYHEGLIHPADLEQDLLPLLNPEKSPTP